MTEQHFPCVQCGSDLRYAPGQTQLTCDHCGHVQAIPAPGERARSRALGELDLNRALADDLPLEATAEIRTTTCPSCNAQVEFQGADHATECPFCATPVVVDTGTQRPIKPQAVLPFALTEDAARGAMISWMGGLWFAPNTLLEYARKGRAMNGIYVPFWTFDADTSSRYSGARGTHHTETRTRTVTVNGRSEQRQETVTRTSWTPVSGHVARDFDDVLVMGSTSLPARLGNELTPWDLTALVPYSADYLAGFRAEGYTVDLHAARDTARSMMARVIENDARRDIGGDAQRVDSVSTDYADETFKHILLPVWMAAYKYNGKSYRFLVNGQTGEVQGERPYSAWKIAFAVLLVALAILTALYLHDPTAFAPAIAWFNGLIGR
ncbi:MAG: primosomal protein N' (replication factor Y) - superfamily II helicase [Paracoccaceae bacterium]